MCSAEVTKTIFILLHLATVLGAVYALIQLIDGNLMWHPKVARFVRGLVDIAGILAVAYVLLVPHA